MYSLSIHPHAADDLRNLMKKDRAGTGRIVALLEQIKSDQKLLDKLTDHDFKADFFHVSRYQAFYRKGINLWRLKIWDLGDNVLAYRVIYAFEPVSAVNRTPKYHVLGIAPREFSYDSENPFTLRIVADYDAL